MRLIGGMTRLGRSRVLAATTAFVLVSQAWASSAYALEVTKDPDTVEVTVESPDETDGQDGQPEEQATRGEVITEEEATDGVPPPAEGEAPAEGVVASEVEALAEGEVAQETTDGLDEAALVEEGAGAEVAQKTEQIAPPVRPG